MQICQVTGYKNSGKTTVMNQLIRHFSDKGLRVGSLKHHGHGGGLTMAEGTDSHQHFESGSRVSGVQGEGETMLTLQGSYTFEELIQLYSSFPLDLLLVEGYKGADSSKVVLLRNNADVSLLRELSNIIAVGIWDKTLTEIQDYPVFDMNDVTNDISALAECIRRDADD